MPKNDKITFCLRFYFQIQTFGVEAPCKTVEDLTSGVVMAQVLQKIDVVYFSDTWISRIKSEVGDNWRLKISNLKKILKGILDYNHEILGQQINDFTLPDVNLIGEHSDAAELGRMLQLILGCAVNCEQKQENIQTIMMMEESVQHVVMTAIQELMSKETPVSAGNDSYADLDRQLKKTVEDLSDALASKEEIAQRCHELDMQVAALQEEKSSLLVENQVLLERLNQSDSIEDLNSPAGRRHLQLQAQLEQLQEETFRAEREICAGRFPLTRVNSASRHRMSESDLSHLSWDCQALPFPLAPEGLSPIQALPQWRLEAAKDDYRIRCEELEKELLEVKGQNEDLTSLADEAQSLKDEMDVLRHSSDKVSKLEAQVESYKKKLEDLGDLRRQVKLLEEKNTSYMQNTVSLEEELRKANATRTQLETYKRQVVELQNRLSEESKKADKMEFECKRLKEKVDSLQKEKDRMRTERDSLKETIEELRCVQAQEGQLTSVGLVPLGSSEASDSLAAEIVTPEIRERLIRLQHENKMLKLNQEGSDNEQIALLKSLLEDANARKNELETENRLVNQRLMAGQSQVEELQKNLQEQGSKADDSVLLKRKCEEHLEKLSDASNELQKKIAIIEDLEPKYNAGAQRIEELEEALKKKDDEMKQMEERYKKYLEKAKSVIRTLDPKQNQGSAPEVQALKNQLQEKERMLHSLEKEYDKAKSQRDHEEKLIVSAWYNMGMALQKKAAEDRLASTGSGQSFLARQRQATSTRRSYPGHVQPATAR
ncbi:protein Hook-like 3 [Silurus asotus]|uniref:Protein Hook homolog 3 n=1 Tax=Silurus asotus TaxID=30991 RepID=A0AAD5AGG7_SILAS|nr:protein Hook-like 3 [Silurus asotus]